MNLCIFSHLKLVKNIHIRNISNMSSDQNTAVKTVLRNSDEVSENMTDVNSGSSNYEDEDNLTADYPRKLSRKPSSIIVKATVPTKRQDLLKWQGWGYKDSGFCLKDDVAFFKGDRYPIAGKRLPHFMNFLSEHLGIIKHGNIDFEVPDYPKEKDYPASKILQKDIQAIKKLGIKCSIEGIDRLVRSQGQGTDCILRLRNKIIVDRIPDIVIWPTCHEEVVKVVQYADKRNISIIPFGGGTSVASTLQCPDTELRPIISMDMNNMNEVLDLDEKNLTICCEAGIIGQDLERTLREKGFTVGHDPDSSEFSTLGGWISTRASGMKKNKYGNIEDLLVSVRLVTPKGVLERKSCAPRVSCGPDFNHLVLGSEGVLGVITEATIKIRPLPEVVHYGSIMFPCFEIGIDCLREITYHKLQPASLRLLDHWQFILGMAMRAEATVLQNTVEGIKLFLLKNLKGFDPNKMCMATLVYEGKKDEVFSHEKKLNKIATKFGGIPAGGSNGKNGYMMTFAIAYIRDIAIEYNVIADSFETSISWDRAQELARIVRQEAHQECVRIGVPKSLILLRIAQTYDAGCCLYIYYAFHMPERGCYLEICDNMNCFLRKIVLKYGGALSHHHGVGKHRRQFYEEFISSPGAQLMRSSKAILDPKNIFSVSNLLSDITLKDKNLLSKL